MTKDSPVSHLLKVGATHQVDLPLRWGDCDALNHLNNTLYFRLMEEARMQWLYSAGVSAPADFGPILAHISCDFLRPLTYPATVEVVHKIVRLGRASLELEAVLSRTGDHTGPYAQGKAVLVWVDYRSVKPLPWPEDVLKRINALMHVN